jgi:Fe-S cluster assembly iron-binding protein IscA
MKLQQVDRLPPGADSFLTVTPAAREEILRLKMEKQQQGAMSCRCDIGAKETVWRYEWRDDFTDEDFVIELADLEIVMDAVSIAYVLDEYTLDYQKQRFVMYKNPRGPLRHQR